MERPAPYGILEPTSNKESKVTKGRGIFSLPHRAAKINFRSDASCPMEAGVEKSLLLTMRGI